MTTAIYYFSGTGNSLTVARDIARTMHCEPVSIGALAARQQVEVASDVVGIVFPVYFTTLPVVVREFAGKLDGIADTYLFAVATYGGSAGISFRELGRALSQRGGTLSARYGIHMTQNAFRKPWENAAKLTARWRKKLDTLCVNTRQRRGGTFFTNRTVDALLAPLIGPVLNMTRNSLTKLTQSPPGLPLETLVRLTDKSYRVTEDCTGCGICARVCPVANIDIADNKPVWRNRCEACLACYNWCPTRAIQGNVVTKGYYYRHPEVSVSDMMHRQSAGGV